jgi:X-X-X-Leu-X-X-Gly heptad repeat protein
MTIENDRPSAAHESGDGPTGSSGSGSSAHVREMASTAREETGTIAATAAEEGKHVMSEVSGQAASVASDAKQQVSNLVQQARDELRTQGEARGEQLASGMQTFADQLSALASGRPEQAGSLGSFVSDAQQRVQSYATSLQERGPRAVVDDLSSFARRRPGTFLLMAGVAGFAVGRLVRAGATASSDGDQSSSNVASGTAMKSAASTLDSGGRADPTRAFTSDQPAARLAQPVASLPETERLGSP